MNKRSLLAVGIVFFTLTALHGADWPIFRGVDRDGISRETGWVAAADAPVAWQAEVGLGYSGAIVADGRVFLTGHEDGAKRDHIYCFAEETGELLWRHTYSQPKGALYFQGGTTASVTVDGEHVYHNARQGEVFCLNTVDGAVVWQKDLAKDFGYSKPTWGFSGAPLILGDFLYLNAGEAGTALNKNTSQLIWKSDDEEAGYSTPYFFEKDDKKLLIFTNKRYYTCVDAATGQEQWQVKWMTRYGVNAADPIVTEDHIFISSGYGKGANLLKWDGTGEPQSLWRSRDMKNQMNACILVGGYLYGIDGNEGQDGTVLKCMAMESGETMWEVEGIGHGGVSAADGQLLVISEQGELQVAPISPAGFQPTYKKQVVSGKVWTVPVLANGRVYCRNDKGKLVVLDFRG